MADKDKDIVFNVQQIDVSEPQEVRKESDVIEEEIAQQRRNWLKTHMIYLYALIGVVIVGIIFLSIHIYNRNANPISRFISASSKNFGTSFNYDVNLYKADESIMHYTGSADFDRSKHTVSALYNADYKDYSYQTVIRADDRRGIKGIYYKDKWSLRNCSANVLDFFDFDTDYRAGSFDGGSFLRFTGLTSVFSSDELQVYMKEIKERLSTNSSIATITTESVDGGTVINYEIHVYELFDMIRKEGASIFYSASDYDMFVEKFNANEDVIKNATCTARFLVNGQGYLENLTVDLTANGTAYRMDCLFSDFGKAEVEIPEGFTNAAETLPIE